VRGGCKEICGYLSLTMPVSGGEEKIVCKKKSRIGNFFFPFLLIYKERLE
jgi:hypothetical protein